MDYRTMIKGPLQGHATLQFIRIGGNHGVPKSERRIILGHFGANAEWRIQPTDQESLMARQKDGQPLRS